jgi:hypothetical protein
LRIENWDRVVGFAVVLLAALFVCEAAGIDPVAEMKKRFVHVEASIQKNISDLSPNKAGDGSDPEASFRRCIEFVKTNSGNKEKLDLGVFACRLSHPLPTMNEPQKSRFMGKCLIDSFSKIQDDTSGTRVVTSCAESSKYPSMGMMLAEIFSPSARVQKIIEAQQEEERSRRSAERSLIDGLGLPRSPGNVRVMEGGLPGTFIVDVDGVLKTCNNFAGVVNCH